MWEDMAGLKPRRDLISFSFRKMWGAVWGGRLCSGEWIREQERGGSYKEGGFSVQREWGSTRHGDLWGGRSSPGVSRLAANALWSGPPIPSLGLSPLSCMGRGGVPNILACAVRPVSTAQDEAPASPHPGSPGTKASCPAGLPCL